MNAKLLTLSLLTMAMLQVACSEDDKNGAQGMTMAQACARTPDPTKCMQNYATPQNVQALAGTAALNGEKQVATLLPGETPKPGQVNAAIPASVIQQQSRQIASTLHAMDADPDFRLTNGTRTLLPAGTNYVPTSTQASASTGGEITVARVPDAIIEAPTQQRTYQPTAAADPNSVFAQPEAGAGAAH